MVTGSAKHEDTSHFQNVKRGEFLSVGSQLLESDELPKNLVYSGDSIVYMGLPA